MAKKAKNALRDDVLAAVPMNWLDPLLTGPKAVISDTPTLRQVENLLRAVRDRQAAIFKEHALGKEGVRNE